MVSVPSTPHDIETIAARLADNRRARGIIDAPSGTLAGSDAAYAIQDAVMRRLGPVGAWKVGAAAPGTEPACSPIPSFAVHVAPGTLALAGDRPLGLEVEIAYRFGRGFAPGGPMPDDAAILEAVASAHAAIELCETRFTQGRDADPLWLTADGQLNLGLVIGEEITGWRALAPPDVAASLKVAGETQIETRGGLAAGDPLPVLCWLVRHAVATRGGIAAGTVVTTGSWTGIIFVPPRAGERVQAEIAGKSVGFGIA
jgi:2-keto-4-pentenoate hydratase